MVISVSSVTGVTVYNITKDGMNVAYNAVVLSGNTAVTYIVKYDNGTNQTVETSATNLHITATPLARSYNISVAYKTLSASQSPFSDVVTTGERNVWSSYWVVRLLD